MVSIKEALRFPFANLKRLFNFYWILIPIWGWFVVSGYAIKIIKQVIAGKNQELPPIRPFKGLVKVGFLLFVVSLVLSIIYNVAIFIPIVGWIIYIYLALISPILILQFAEIKRIRDGLNFIEATRTVFANLKLYIVTYLKTIVVVLVLLLASALVITLIFTLPAMAFVQYYIWAEFYKEMRK